ncbi:DUF4870 domain-containing protein [Brooklawnia cerclae]|uniref:DUF4870 domain-containing protein n=1 Tax=Brooklawnia cerclae TaxID=349934 RepID=A0ABX0SKC9_9ACTN|nr:DUF4870 domain-containing protein [Brooklawnia cerclae]NIH58857.1 hypothetical protein [Brooklawnia cerclae]
MTNFSTPSAGVSPDEERTAAVLSHLAGPISSFVSAGWLAIVGPLVAWFIYRNRSPWVRSQAAEAFNFQVTMWIAAVVGGLLCLTIILIPVGVVLVIAAVICSIVMGILAAVKTANGENYRYPWRLEFLK